MPQDGVLTPLIKQLTESAIQGGLDSHLAKQSKIPNHKNGSTPKMVKSLAGAFELDTPRDRAGTFESKLVEKHQTHLTDELERKIIALFALGNSYRTFAPISQSCMGFPFPTALNAITDKLLPEFQAWRERDLEAVYLIVWLDAIHYKIKAHGRYVSNAIYTILGLNIGGKKELCRAFTFQRRKAPITGLPCSLICITGS